MGYYDKSQHVKGITLKVADSVVKNAVIEIGETTTGEPGTDAEVENVGTDTHAILNFTIPAGAGGKDGQDGHDGSDGAPGQDGQDGVSPTVTISKSGKVTTITITDATGEHTATIEDGADGQNGHDGSDGSDGQDGFSPTVSISKSGTTTTITITDATGAHTATIEDGAAGAAGQDGDDGVTFTPTVTAITGGHRLSWTNDGGKQNPQAVDILDGADGATGPAGPAGAAGQGVAPGGTTGQVLTKLSGTDYDTTWATPSGGGGSVWDVEETTDPTEANLAVITLESNVQETVSTANAWKFTLKSSPTCTSETISPEIYAGRYFSKGYSESGGGRTFYFDMTTPYNASTVDGSVRLDQYGHTGSVSVSGLYGHTQSSTGTPHGIEQRWLLPTTMSGITADMIKFYKVTEV